MANDFVWKGKEVIGTSKLKNHTASLVGGRLYIFAGYFIPAGRSQKTTWILDCSQDKFTLNLVKISGDFLPAPRNGHSAHVVEDKLFIFGGWGGFSILHDVAFLDLVMCQWTAPVTHGARHPLMNMHVSEYMEHIGKIIFFGGGDGQSFLNQTTALDVRSMRWTELTPKGNAPDARANCSSCKHGFTMYIFGGWNSGGKLNDIHLLNCPDGSSRPWWSSPRLKGNAVPRTRVGGGLASFRNKLVLFGGYHNGTLDDVHVFDPVKETWLEGTKSMSSSKSNDSFKVSGKFPSSRTGHTFTAIGDKYILSYGGRGNTNQDSMFIANKLYMLHPV